jgi:fluoride exporter
LSEVLNWLHAASEAGLARAGLTPVYLAWIAVGSGLGGVARFFVAGIVARRVGESFPWGTMVVNVSGAFAIGAFAAAAAGGPFSTSAGVWSFTVIGLIGSYTTVSSFSLQTLELARGGEYRRAVGYIFASLALCLSAVTLGAVAGGTGMKWLAS